MLDRIEGERETEQRWPRKLHNEQACGNSICLPNSSFLFNYSRCSVFGKLSDVVWYVMIAVEKKVFDAGVGVM